MSINNTLKFSWAHIIAFVSMIFASYLTFMGITYFTDGNFILAGLGVVFVLLIIAVFFIVPQILKGRIRNFRKNIKWERALLIISPFVFLFAMLPAMHFGSIFDRRTEVKMAFAKSIHKSEVLFESYEAYSLARLKAYGEEIEKLKKMSVGQKANKYEALELQLLGSNFNNLSTVAMEWINKTDEASIWNVFMFGNLKEVETAIDSWANILMALSSVKLSDENHEASVPYAVSEDIKNFDELRSLYKTIYPPTVLSIVVVLLLFFFLILPYLVQSRNTKSTFGLFGSRSASETSGSGIDMGSSNSKNKTKSNSGSSTAFTLD